MLTTRPTEEMIAQWKALFKAHRPFLTPNRKSGRDVDRYFRKAYPCRLLDRPAFRDMVAQTILDNAHFKDKLPENTLPDVRCYQTGNVLVGIDLITGEFHTESAHMEEVIPIHDDLFVYRGLDRQDLENFFLVAQYVTLRQTSLASDKPL